MTVPATWQAPADLDPECLALCQAINNHVPGITTTESCCGHDKGPYRIWVQAANLDDLPPLLYWLDSCHTGFRGWQMIAYTDCAADHVTLMIEGPAGAYGQADAIAGHLNRTLAATR